MPIVPDNAFEVLIRTLCDPPMPDKAVDDVCLYHAAELSNVDLEMTHSSDISVMLNNLSSEYQPNACGNSFRGP